MTESTVNGSGNGARSGAQTLALLASPLNVLILRALGDGPKQQAELRRATGSPAQTTLRAHLKKLGEIETIEKHRQDRFPGALEYELTAAGRALLLVAGVLECWLSKAPDGPVPLDVNAAKAPIKALAEGWSTTMLRALATGPLSLTELDGIITSLTYPALERRLGALRLAGLVTAQSTNGRGTPYAVTEWLCQGMAPLAAAARWERRYMRHSSASIGRIDAEAVFLLSVPLWRPSPNLCGVCRMAVEIPGGKQPRLAGVTIEVGGGRIGSCTTPLRKDADSWAVGSPTAWLDAVIIGDTAQLELGGECQLAFAVIDGLHTVLFRSPSQIRLKT